MPAIGAETHIYILYLTRMLDQLSTNLDKLFRKFGLQIKAKWQK